MNDGYSHNSIRLTAVEIGHLWNTYMLESLVHHVFTCYASNADDEDIHSILNLNVEMTRGSLDHLSSLFNEERIPIPRGITSEDINKNAPRLFSDKFYIIYLSHMARFALQNFALAYAQSSSKAIMEFFEHYLKRLTQVNRQVTDLALAKGIYSRSPAISMPTQVDFVKDMSFFSGLFGKKRPLTVLEITHLFNNAESNAVGKAFISGLAQITVSTTIKNYFLRGKALSEKLIGLFSNVLAEEDVSRPQSYESEVIRSTESPFSDRLMLFHINFLNTGGFASYGMAIAASPRIDLALLYTRMLLQVGLYSKAGANLMVKNGWLEQPPTANQQTIKKTVIERKKLVPQPAMKPMDERNKDRQNK